MVHNYSCDLECLSKYVEMVDAPSHEFVVPSFITDLIEAVPVLIVSVMQISAALLCFLVFINWARNWWKSHTDGQKRLEIIADDF